MDFKRLFAFFVLAMAVMLGWEYIFPSPKSPPAPTSQTAPAGQNTQTNGQTGESPAASATVPVTVTTDTVKAVIDEKSGDLRQLVLLNYDAASDAGKRFILFDNEKNYRYMAQADLLTRDGNYLLNNVSFTAAQKNYTLNGDKVEVRLAAPETDGITVSKIYTFTKGSYLIDVRFDVANKTGKPLQLDAAYRLLRDDSKPDGSNYFDHTYAGPVLYTPEDKFQKISFGDLDSAAAAPGKSADYTQSTSSGWVGMTQHYFMSTWILQPKAGNSVCAAGTCQIDIRRRNDGLYSSGVRVPLKPIAAGATAAFPMELYAGPQEYSIITKVADHLQMIKDYGKVSLFASPLFWLLNKWHELVGNWGWAIILLTLTVKAVLFPLTNTSYKSMAKMRAVAPRLQALKELHGDDRMKLQQEMMALYKKEKINPLGGCLPMLLQIPVFIGLYWALFASVELRQAPWIGWITDLARQDPYYVLPVLMAFTMYIQTHLNPPPPDPMQAKMMKILPLVFSIMFFFFPAGLVLYWLTNNIITIGQQWFINKRIERAQKVHHRLEP